MSVPQGDGERLKDIYGREHAMLHSREEKYVASIFTVVKDTISLPGSAPFVREYMRHDDAVAIVAVREHEGREQVLLIRQYRHAAGATLWEIPAGLADVEGEDLLTCARRELAEEAELAAESYELLPRFFTSPGCSTELLQVFLARGVYELPESEKTFERVEEEAEIEVAWFDLDDVLARILDGSLASPTLVVGVLGYVASQRVAGQGA